MLVDDGSSDRTAELLQELSRTTPELVAVLLRRNYGQTAAMAAGFDASRGDEIVTLDGDLQNDPADIPMIVEKLRQGYDLVVAGATNAKTQPSAGCCPRSWPTN